jgi:adenylate kinase family enzyme
MNRMVQFEEPVSLSRSDTGLQLEFFGLPGSGKTTIAREVHAHLARTDHGVIFAADLLGDDNSKASRTAKKLGLVLGELLRDASGLAAVRRTLRVPQAGPRDKARAAFNLATVRSLYARLERRKENAVLDQGLLQALWSVQLRAPDGSADPLLRDILREAAPKRRIYVSVSTPPKVCAQRLATRASKHSRMQTQADAQQQWQAWETAEKLRLSILQALRHATDAHGLSAQIIRVDGTSDTADIAASVAKQINWPGLFDGRPDTPPGKN